jgi:GT2 family glycosyltransferase
MTARLIAGAFGSPDGPYDADIIILALERPVETLAAIESARRQTGISMHIFVLDQGSCSDTLALLAHAIQGRRDVTLLAAERNLGVPGGRNLISALGHGRVIVALDNDAEFADTKTVARMVAALGAEPRLGAIGCRIVTYAGGGDDLSSWGYPLDLLPCAGENFDAVTYVGAGHAILREAWQQAGGYDDRLFFCWEEFDFCLRAIEAGWRIRYHGDIQIRHKVSADRRCEWSETRWFYFVRNRLYIGRKWGASWLSLAPRFAGYLLKGARNGVLTQTLRALPAAVRLASTMPALRQSPATRAYLGTNDTNHRGQWLSRLTREGPRMLSGQDEDRRPACIDNRSRTSKGTIAGLSIR